VLLRMLEDDPHLVGVSHVLVDEVQCTCTPPGRTPPHAMHRHAPPAHDPDATP